MLKSGSSPRAVTSREEDGNNYSSLRSPSQSPVSRPNSRLRATAGPHLSTYSRKVMSMPGAPPEDSFSMSMPEHVAQSYARNNHWRIKLECGPPQRRAVSLAEQSFLNDSTAKCLSLESDMRRMLARASTALFGCSVWNLSSFTLSVPIRCLVQTACLYSPGFYAQTSVVCLG